MVIQAAIGQVRQEDCCWFESGPGLMDETMFSLVILFFLEKAGKVAQCEKAPAAKPDGLNSIPGAHVLEGENSLSRCHLAPSYVHCFLAEAGKV